VCRFRNLQAFPTEAQLQEELLRAFTARVFPVIGEVAREKKLWAVFGSAANLMWRDPAIDLTDEIARRLDAKPQ
jgi:Skp family chaperone for outer membrane proteins